MNKTAQAPPVFRKTADTFAPGAKTLPQQYFVSEKIFEEEQTKIFAQQWILVGHQSQIAKAGDYFSNSARFNARTTPGHMRSTAD